MNETTSIALVVAGLIGVMCFLTGIAMIYEPAALIVLGAFSAGGCLAVAHVRGRAAA